LNSAFKEVDVFFYRAFHSRTPRRYVPSMIQGWSSPSWLTAFYALDGTATYRKQVFSTGSISVSLLHAQESDTGSQESDTGSEDHSATTGRSTPWGPSPHSLGDIPTDCEL